MTGTEPRRHTRFIDAGDAAARDRLERYVTAVVARFRADARVSFWDLYNEPDQVASEGWVWAKAYGKVPGHWLDASEKLPAALRLLQDSFAWARRAAPTQPLTSGVWTFPENIHDLADPRAVFFHTLFGLSDILSFHCYCDEEVRLYSSCRCNTE